MVLFRTTVALLALVAISEAQQCAPPIKNSNCIYNQLDPYPRNLKCQTRGTLSSPAVLAQYSPCSTISFDACKDLCRSLKRCISFSYDFSFGAVQCTLYRKPIISMGFQPSQDSSSNVFYWNKLCFNQQCSNLMLNSGFEYTNMDGTVATWTGSNTCSQTKPAFQDIAVGGSYSYSCFCQGGGCDFVDFVGSLAAPLDTSQTYTLTGAMSISWDPEVPYQRLRILLGDFTGQQLYFTKFCQPDVATSCDSGEYVSGGETYNFNTNFVPSSDSTSVSFIVDYPSPGQTGTTTSFDNIQVAVASDEQR